MNGTFIPVPENITDPVLLYQVPPYMVILLSICYGSISVLATAGNGLVIWVIVGSRRMRNVTNYYIANLALADFLLAVFAIPFEVSGKCNYLKCDPKMGKKRAVEAVEKAAKNYRKIGGRKWVE